MSRRAFPAHCPNGDGSFASREEAEAHYAGLGFRVLDADGGWAIMRRGVFEAYVRPANRARVGWVGSVVQLSEEA